MSTDWIPFELMRAGQRTMVRWVHPGEGPLPAHPFFSQSMDALIAAHAVQKLTPIDELADVAPRNQPQGFIFHVSRCGSTLASRSLAAVARHRVIAEPAPLNQLLLAEYPAEQQAKLLKGLIHALCGSAGQNPCIFKFTSWNLLFLQQILTLFPNTPWVFIYREPVDVLQSLLARPPNWANNEPLRRIAEASRGTAGEPMIAIVEQLFAAPLPHTGRLALAVNYSQFPGAVLQLAAHFGLALDALEQQQVLQMAQYDAKQPGQVNFVARARAPVTDDMRAALAPLDARYQQWEQIRATSHAV